MILLQRKKMNEMKATTNSIGSVSSYHQNGGGVDNLLAVVLKDLDNRVQEWNAKVESEKSMLQKEWLAIEEEKQRIKARTKILDESADDIANGLQEVQRLRAELDKRLAVTPMDLNAAQLQEEWQKIDQEKVQIKRSADELQIALDRLADAQAALEMLQ
jgi:succinate dehydrogenase/fumarate reductase flavoprotein subunit